MKLKNFDIAEQFNLKPGDRLIRKSNVFRCDLSHVVFYPDYLPNQIAYDCYRAFFEEIKKPTMEAWAKLAKDLNNLRHMGAVLRQRVVEVGLGGTSDITNIPPVTISEIFKYENNHIAFILEDDSSFKTWTMVVPEDKAMELTTCFDLSEEAEEEKKTPQVKSS